MWVEPQPWLMLIPSGSEWIAVTSAPARWSAAGATADAAPLAQSTTTRIPVKGVEIVPTRKEMYLSAASGSVSPR